jgi:hypothetical protein
MPASATAALPFAARSQTPQLSHFFHIPAPPLFAAYKLYEFGIIEPRALPIHFALHDMYGRRRIGRHRFYKIDLSKITDAIGHDNYRVEPRRNRTAVNRLFAVGLWNETAAGIRPAKSLDDLTIDSRQIDAIQEWRLENKAGRPSFKIPRYLLAGMPGFAHSQIAVALELIRRPRWSGDASETTATMWLPISEIAARWGIDPRSVQRVINAEDGLGEHVRFEVLPTHWSQRQQFGNKYRVIITPPRVASKPAPEDEKPIRITTSIPSDFAQILSPPPSDFAQILSPPDLQFCNPLRVYKNQSCEKAQPKNAKPGAGVYQFQNPGEGMCDLDLSVESTVDGPIASARIQEGCHVVVDTADDDATADTAPSADTAALEDLDVTATPAVMTHTPTADDTVRLALVTDTPTAPVSAPSADEAGALVKTVDTLPAVVNAPCPDANTAADDQTADTVVNDHAGDILRPGADPAIRPPAISASALVTDALPPPDLKHILPEDLRDMARLDLLRDQAIDAGYIGRSDADRLRFVRAAVRARETGRNPPAMFRTLVAKGLWTHATGKQEDTANAMLKAYDWGAPPALRVVPKAIPPPLSEDARTVAIVREWQRAEQSRDDPLQAFKKRFAEGRDWTRARWDAASHELDSKGGQTRGREI